MTRPEFNPKDHYEKTRDSKGSVSYVQNGHRFSAGRGYVGKLGEADVNPAVQVSRKQELRASIAEKLRESSKLKGFTENETPDEVIDALKENEAAKQAEDNS